MYAHLLGSFAYQVDDFSNEIRTDSEALQNFLVFLQNILSDKPNETVSFRPPVEKVGTRIFTRKERLSEAGYPSHHHARVNDGPQPAPAKFPPQR